MVTVKAPQKSQAKSSSSRTSTTSTTASQASAKQKNWSKVRKSVCKLCEQSTHDYETVLLPKKVFLTWLRSEWSVKANAYVPIGHECYPCYDTRRRYFEENHNDFLALMQQSPELSEKFKEYRRGKLLKLKDFQKETRMSAQAFVTRQKRKYVDCYKQGLFYKFKDMCKKLGLDDKLPRDKLKKAIEAKHSPGQVTFGKNEAGTYGVTVWNDGPMIVRQGVATEKVGGKKTKYAESDEDLAEADLESVSNGGHDDEAAQDQDARGLGGGELNHIAPRRFV